ncbi:hypothetical protein ACHAXR_012961, partial [Thalassiosira sp. AJA248-18]
MKIASFPPNRPRPPTHDAARHINEEARLVLASLRGGPPYVARGELALGLRELRSFVRGRFLDLHHGGGVNVGGVGENGGDYYGHSQSNLGVSASAANAASAAKMTPREEVVVGEDDNEEAAPPQIRMPPPSSPKRGEDQLQLKGSVLPPPLPAVATDVVNETTNNDESAKNGKAVNEDEEPAASLQEQQQQQQQHSSTPPSSPIQGRFSPPTPHSVPPSSPDPSMPPPPPFPPISPNNPTTATATAPPSMPDDIHQQSSSRMTMMMQQHQQQSQQQHQQQPLDPGPYATPFLAVIVDPRAAGPHTLVALRALHRLLERGSIVQITRSNSNGAAATSAYSAGGNGEGGKGSQTNNAPTNNNNTATAAPSSSSQFVAHETSLEPIARGVLACRFEQTDAGADEAVEMAIADLLKLLVELDAAGSRAAEAVLLRQVYIKRQQQQQRQSDGGNTTSNVAQRRASNNQQQQPTSTTTVTVTTTTQQQQPNKQQQQRPSSSSSGTMLRIQRLPSSILMEAFHAVFVTRHTFVRDGGGHHSPALSFHFEQVLMRMVHCVFGGEDVQSSLKNKGGGGGSGSGGSSMMMLSSRHVSAARKIMEFLIDCLRLRRSSSSSDASSSSGQQQWGDMMMDAGDDGRTLCLRLIQCCLRTGWGNNNTATDGNNHQAAGAATKAADKTTALSEEDQVLLHLIEDDLCLALLTTGQAIWSHHDNLPSSNSHSNASSSSSSGGDLGGNTSGTSLELLSEVCATLSLLWSLPRLRLRLRCQFEAVFSGFYQRALSLLRRRPLPEDGAVYQANMIFDMEVEMILESLVDVLCLSSDNGGGGGGGGGGNGGSSGKAAAGKSMSTMEDLFLTYDCSTTESDVASGLLVELSRCCGGVIDEEGEPYLPSPSSSSSMPPSRRGSSTGAQTPRSNESERSIGASPGMLIARHRSVPDHLKELCFEALLGSLRRLFHGAESLSLVGEANKVTVDGAGSSSNSSFLRTAKNKKRSLHHAARLFNEKPKKGLQYLADNGMLPNNPPDPKSVASFLRNGLVVGLEKTAVGQYLGEIGKNADKTAAAVWDQDWFHKELLTAFCSSFAFERLTVLDGLRMFLSSFRLPGEAQMIDRILQAFAESISRKCEESKNGSLNVFPKDEKRASDAAYLLSFSIIMLNTDLHNENIRADRKMKLGDFIRNNKNYGKEISDEDFPPEYLEGIYRSIKEEQIRTLGEGADGSMTAERWKDVMRSASSFQSHEQQPLRTSGAADAKDLKELLLESSWQPILSAVSGLWGMVPWEVYQADVIVGAAPDQNGTLMGARLGIDLAYEMLSGASNLSRPDIFQDVFTNVCHMSGLLSQYDKATEERADIFISSIEHQSAFTVAVNVAEENGDMIGLDGWKCVWGMLFELRDLQLLSGRRRPNIMKEGDPDLLSPEARALFCRRMANWDDEYDQVEGGQPRKGMSLMSFVFGSSESLEGGGKNTPAQGGRIQSSHGKEEHLVWDDLSPSDLEDERSSSDTEYLSFPSERFSPQKTSSIGASFENQLVYESTLDNEEIGVTGLERIDISHSNPKSLRARVRQRLSQLVDFYGLITESRYLSEEGLSDTLNSLVEIIRDSSKKQNNVQQDSDNDEAIVGGLPLSPASEAFAEILLCEIALKNRDRFALVWNNILRAHYNSRLTIRPSKDHQSETIKLTPGVEKCVTGILRLCVWTSNRNMIANQVLSTLKILHPPLGALIWSPLELNLDKHLAEGLWRICRNVDGLTQIDNEGWSGILGLAEWCATRGGLRSNDQLGSLAEDDPSLQAFRSLHLILHAVELKDSLQVSTGIVRSVRCLVEAGERGYCPKLSIAGLDLLQVLHTRMESLVVKEGESQHLLNQWVPILEAISEPAEKSRNGSVRQQAISLLTDTLLDRHGSKIPVDSGLCEIMKNICIPLADKRITDLLRIPYEAIDLDETLIELELCISLLFKPFLHHLKALISVKEEFVGIWISMLGIMTQLLGEESAQNEEDNVAVREGVVTREKLFLTTRELGSEHLRNAILVLAAMGVLINDGDSKSDAQEISSVTW